MRFQRRRYTIAHHYGAHPEKSPPARRRLGRESSVAKPARPGFAQVQVVHENAGPARNSDCVRVVKLKPIV